MQSTTSLRIRLQNKLFSAQYHSLPVILLLFSTISALLAATFADPDLWGHLRFGLDFLQTGVISQVDPYSYLSVGQRWINHEWLAEVLFALAWTAGGVTGLILFKAGVGVLTFALLFIYLRQFSDSMIRLSILLLLPASVLIPFYSPVRPQLFSILIFTVTLLTLVKAELGFYRWLWGLAPLFALWTNLHGAFLAGVGVLGIWSAVHLLLHPRTWRQIIPPAILCVIVLLVNPYGMDLLIFLLRTATVPRPEIDDWQPVQIGSVLGVCYLILLLISASALILSRRERRLSLVTLFFILSLLPLMAVRHLQLFAPAVLVLAGEHILDTWARRRPKPLQHPGVTSWLQAISIAGVIIMMINMAFNLYMGIQVNQKIPLPRSAVSFLKGMEISGNMAVPFNWGEYVLWHLGPTIKVSLDGRRETVYSEEVYTQNINFMLGRGEWDAIITDYDTHLALVEKGSPPYNLLYLNDSWLLVYEDEVSGLFVRGDTQLFKQFQNNGKNFIPAEDIPSFP